MQFSYKKINEDVIIPDDEEYLGYVKDILENPAFRSMKNFIQHGDTSCLSHCIAVSYKSYKSCKKLGLDAKAAARAGLLHDMFLYDWHTHSPGSGLQMHGFSHPKAALKNAEQEFTLTGNEKEIIVKHMWPLTVIPPKSKEAYVVLYHDKVCSVQETFKKPSLAIYNKKSKV